MPGDDVKLTFPSRCGQPPKIVSDNFTIVDFYESKMSEYDASFVFVPIRKLQELRGMIDPTTGVGLVNAIQIKLKPGADGERGPRQAAGGLSPRHVRHLKPGATSKGPLLAAVQMETAILNILLFLIIAVAGFGILAIFYMIVVEKTRDIGILKSLGRLGPRRDGHLPGLRAVAGGGRLRRGHGGRAAVRPLHQRDRRRARLDHRPARVRSVDLLLLQDSRRS